MKILFIAVFSDTSTNNSQSRSFKRAGCEVIEYNYRERAIHVGKLRDQEIIDTCFLERPDYVLFSKCNGVHYSVIDECNKVSRTILWYMDPMMNFDVELIEKIKRCKYTFCALTEPYLKSKEYSNSTHFLHEGFDSDVNVPVDMPYRHDISFIGNMRGERSYYCEKLKKYNFNNYQLAFGKEHCVAVAQSRINLNFTEGGTSDRTYKVLASKGFLLTQPWIDMEKDFEDGKDLVAFSNELEFSSKIEYYLNHEEKRKAIAEHGHKTVQKFTRHAWANSLLKIIS